MGWVKWIKKAGCWLAAAGVTVGVILLVLVLFVVFDVPCMVANAVSRGRVCRYDEELERLLYPWDYDD